MAIRLHMNHDLSQEKQSVLHLMPCKIYGDESANVSTYFTPYIREVDDKGKFIKFELIIDKYTCMFVCISFSANNIALIILTFNIYD